MKSPLHLQTEKPVLSWEDWWLELNKIYADKFKIPLNAASRYISIDKAREWYDDGFTPYVTFRENF